jgi:hypothetical protein
VLAHEAVHAARSAFNEVENEEFFAYMTAQNRFHRIFGPILFRPWEVWPFFFMIVLGMFSSVGYLGASLWLGLGLYRLIRQHKKLQKAFKYIVSFLNDPKKARSVLLRLTDLEITLLSEGNDLQEYAKKQQCLRWRLISLAYLKQNSCGDSNMGEVSSPMFESPQV